LVYLKLQKKISLHFFKRKFSAIRLFQLFRFFTETASFGVSIEPNKTKTNRNKPKQGEGCPRR